MTSQTTKSSDLSEKWVEHAEEKIREAGLRRSTPRQQVVELMASQDCALTALEMDSQLSGVGRATVYRAIDQLEELGLIQRIDLGGSAHGYEKLEPSGHHHHHIVCDGCGKVEPFEDEALEIAIHGIQSQSFKLETHEVTLHGHCADCS